MKHQKHTPPSLPIYSAKEEIWNIATHIPGIFLGLTAFALLLTKIVPLGDPLKIFACSVYALGITAVFTVSSIYHGLPHSSAKQVMRTVDHCTIYLLIAGTYTAVLLCVMRECFPVLALGLMCFEWICAALATTLTAMDLKRYSIFSMVCYIGMGWAVIPFWRQVLQVMTAPGFAMLLAGGIAYSIGSVLYGLGKRKPWMHSVFHLFVDLGALLQFLSISLYAL